MKYIAILFSGGDVIAKQSETPADHLKRLATTFNYAAETEPQFINCLAGNDRWSMDQQVEFFGAAMELAKHAGQRCLFETHRGTSLYSPWVTLELMRQLPEMRFTSDLSHWVLVAERLLETPEDCEALAPFIERVDHVQTRVGYAQGPQTPHPGAPEYAGELAFFQKFWEQVWHSQKQRGVEVATLTPEFGPDDYLHHLPFTNVPVADLWSLNAWMAREERRHFNQWTNQVG